MEKNRDGTGTDNGTDGNQDNNSGLLDMRQLEKPVNAFLWMAEFLGEVVRKHPKLSTPMIKHRMAWLLEMGRLLPHAVHDRPAVLFTLAEAATDTNLRRGLIRVLADLDQLAVKAAKQSQPGS